MHVVDVLQHYLGLCNYGHPRWRMGPTLDPQFWSYVTILIRPNYAGNREVPHLSSNGNYFTAVYGVEGNHPIALDMMTPIHPHKIIPSDCFCRHIHRTNVVHFVPVPRRHPWLLVPSAGTDGGQLDSGTNYFPLHPSQVSQIEIMDVIQE